MKDAFVVRVAVSSPMSRLDEYDVRRSCTFFSTLLPLGENGGSSSSSSNSVGGGIRERRGVDSRIGGGGRSYGGGGGGRGRGRGGRSSSNSRASSFSSSSSRSNSNKKQELGPNGHDYQQSIGSIANNNSMFAESDIHTLLAKRLQAKFDRDFRTADAIQMELINGGVYIQDELREWRADGVPYDNNSGGGVSGGRRKSNDNSSGMQYTKSPHSPATDNLPQIINDDLIQKLVYERAKYKFTRQYDKADLVREGLRTKFNVIIDDRLRQWSVGGDFGSEHNAVRESMELLGSRGYIKSKSSLSAKEYNGEINDADDDDDDDGDGGDDDDGGNEMEEYIQYHVDARAAMKKEGKFDTADKIRLDLAQRYDVA